MFEAVFFDMDGLLINSEPFWKAAEKEVFGSLGIEVTDAHTCKTSLMTTKRVTEYWYNHQPWKNRSLKDVEQDVIRIVGEHIDNKGVMMPGVIELLHYFKQSGYKIGLATNSPHCLIPRVLHKLNIAHYFDSILSSDFVEKGKPSPDIYIKGALEFNVVPSKCIVFEDSKSGIRAALSAGMSVVAVPESGNFDDKGFDIADIKIRTLSDFCDKHIRLLNKTTINS